MHAVLHKYIIYESTFLRKGPQFGDGGVPNSMGSPILPDTGIHCRCARSIDISLRHYMLLTTEIQIRG